MITKLTTVGDSQAVVIDRQLLTLLDITEDTALEVKSDRCCADGSTPPFPVVAGACAGAECN